VTTRVLGVANSGRVVDCVVGDQLLVRLPENRTTGYQWQPVELPAALELADDTFDLDQPTEVVVGGGGTRQLTFVIAEAGAHQLRLRYWQPWEREASTTQEVSFSVHVRAR
jgi:predicted secreted protein